MFTREFWKATTERALSTAAQSALAVLAVGEGLNAFHVSWGEVGGVALGGAVLAVLKALVASQVGNGGPSLVKAERLSGRHAA